MASSPALSANVLFGAFTRPTEYKVEEKRMHIVALALIGLALLGTAPASAQYYGGRPYYEEDREYGPPRDRPGRRYYDGYRDDGPPPYGRGRPREFYEPRRPAYGYGRPQGFGRVCVTSRGNCQARPGPINSSCGCNIPGFGPKRGAIGF